MVRAPAKAPHKKISNSRARMRGFCQDARSAASIPLIRGKRPDSPIPRHAAVVAAGCPRLAAADAESSRQKTTSEEAISGSTVPMVTK